MSNTLTSFNAFRGRKTIAAGILGMLVLAGCGSAETPGPKPTQSTTETVTPSPSAPSVEATPKSKVNEYLLTAKEERNLIVLMQSMSPKKEELTTKEALRAAVFAPFYPEVIQEACITKFEAEQFKKVIYGMHDMTEGFLQDRKDLISGEGFGGRNVGVIWSVGEYGKKSADALVANAVDETTCPNGSNTKMIRFEHKGEVLETSARQILATFDGENLSAGTIEEDGITKESINDLVVTRQKGAKSKNSDEVQVIVFSASELAARARLDVAKHFNIG